MYCEEHKAAGMVSKSPLATITVRGKPDVSEAAGAGMMLQPQADWPCMLLLMQVNVIAGRCEREGCNTIAWYGYQGENSRFCNRHKLPGMVGTQRARICAG